MSEGTGDSEKTETPRYAPPRLSLDKVFEIPSPQVEVPRVEVIGLQQAGIRLSYFMLKTLTAIIALYIVLGALGYYDVGRSSFEAILETRQATTLTQEQVTQLAKLAAEEHARIMERQKAFLEMWLESAKLILQLILVPIITAILGYTFGSNSNNPTGSES